MIISLGPGATLAVAFVVVGIGVGLTRLIPVLDRYAIPIALSGGVSVAACLTLFKHINILDIAFDMAWRGPLLLAFFATVGLSASYRSLLQGGRKTMLFLVVATILLVSQDGLGVGMAWILGLDPLYGLMAGSMTLSGGHGTGLAWAEALSGQLGGVDLSAVAIVAATFGLIAGGCIGGPVASLLIRRHRLRAPNISPSLDMVMPDVEQPHATIAERDFLPMIAIIGFCVMVGMLVKHWWAPELGGITIPGFVWSIFAGIIVRNIFEVTGWYTVSPAAVAILGGALLTVFIALAALSIDLLALRGLGLSLLAILVAQTIFMALFAYGVTFRVMGGGYEAAVIAGGHCGFGLGATPIAVSNMQALTRRYGPCLQAFLVVPIVGAFFIDIINAIVISTFLWLPLGW